MMEKSLELEGKLDILSIEAFYWKNGTHYYTPIGKQASKYIDTSMTCSEFIYKAQHPLQNVLVVGEVVAENQGWTEGALDSVVKAVTKKWINM